MADDLSEFDYLAQAAPDDASAGDPAQPADDADVEQQQLPAQEQEPQAPQAPEQNATAEQIRELNARLRSEQQRVDELMRLLLSQRGPEPQQAPAPEIDPDVRASVSPLLEERLREYDAIKRDYEHRQQLATLEEASPGIGAMWPQIQEEFGKLPAHLRKEFDTMAGAIALRERIERRTGAGAAGAAAGKRRAHTESAPGGGQRTRALPTRQEVMNMSRADFEAFTEALQRAQRAPAKGGYDPLIE